MSTYFYGSHQQNIQNPHTMMQSTNHHGRSRRGQRMSSTQPNNRHLRHQQHQQQHQKPIEKLVISEPPALTAFRARFEAGRSFDLDDDLEFCPNLLTWDERQSVTSGSDRSSLSSGSPESSPLQQQIQPHLTPALALPSASYVSPPTSFSMHNLKLHQPSAIRSRNPIPIVNPDTRTRMSPPSSISPSMMQQSSQRRW
jgi:hypothetical protein